MCWRSRTIMRFVGGANYIKRCGLSVCLIIKAWFKAWSCKILMEGDGRWIINLGNSICGVSLLALPYCYSQVTIYTYSILFISFY